MKDELLKLKAESKDDLAVISAVLQDAVVRVGDLAYLPREHRFAMVLNRYRWEKEALDGAGLGRRRDGERVRAGLHFNGVLKAQVQHVPLADRSHVMEILAIEVEEREDGAATVLLDFSGFATIRLEVECIDARLDDLSEPWSALRRPAHAVP